MEGILCQKLILFGFLGFFFFLELKIWFSFWFIGILQKVIGLFLM